MLAHLVGLCQGELQFPVGNIPISTRNFWMNKANEALNHVRGTPCPFYAFGSVIVNHTAGGLGELVCMGANEETSGNPILHGEIAAINNCSSILADPDGPYNLTVSQVRQAWQELTLYTNAEPCPMCATAIRWAGFKELVFGTSIWELKVGGFTQIPLYAEKLFSYTMGLSTRTSLLGGVLSNETAVYFGWQHDEAGACPNGCERVSGKCRKAATE